MDGNAFDDVVRNLSERGSRRSALRVLAGALGALAGSQATGTLAKGKGKKKGKGKGKKKKSHCPKKKCPGGFIRDKLTCECICPPQPCPDGKLWNVDECDCMCPPRWRECHGGCVAPGQCCPGDEPCPDDPRGCCIPGLLEVCTINGCCAEIPGQKACNDSCVQIDSNPHHCGDCNVECKIGERCVNGRCVPECEAGLSAQGECCQDGRPHCDDRCCTADEECCGGECVGVQWDPENCGACGNACDERAEACFQGQCHEICSLNTEYTVACDDGVDHWCCPERSPVCCRLSGNPHCC